MPRRRPPIMAASTRSNRLGRLRHAGEQHGPHRVLGPPPVAADALVAVVDGQRPHQREHLVPVEVRQRATADPLVAGDRPRHDGGIPRPADRRARPSCPRGRGARPGPSRRDRWRRGPSRARPAPAAPRRTRGCPGARRPRAKPAPARVAAVPRTRPAPRPARATDRPRTTSRRRPSSAPARRASWCPASTAPRPAARQSTAWTAATVSSSPSCMRRWSVGASAGDVVVEGGRRSGDVPAHQRHGEEGRADPSRIVHHHRGRRRRDAGRGQRVLHHGLRRRARSRGRSARAAGAARPPPSAPARGRRARSRWPGRRRHGRSTGWSPGTRDRRRPWVPGRGGPRPSARVPPPVRRRHAGPPSPCAEAR